MIKVDVISGFLGAGKTTLIKKIFESVLEKEKVVLIENEFGEIGIDSTFLKDSNIQIQEINAGCICCSLVGDFASSMKEVIDRFAPERIIIEPSGVGKLSDIVNAVLKLEEDVKINILATVVDGVKTKMYLKNFGEFFNNQVEAANTIVISKTDKMSEDKIEEVVNLVKEKNNHATLITTPIQQLDSKQLVDVLEQKVSLKDELIKEMQYVHEHENDECCCNHEHHHDDDECCCHHEHHHDDDECCCNHEHHHDDDECCCNHEHHHDDDECCCNHEHHHDDDECCCNHEHHHHDADEVFTSYGKETTRSYSHDELSNILSTLANDDSLGIIIRSKGVIKASDNDNWYYFDFVSGDFEIRLGRPDYIGRIVVIGSHINEEKIESLFFKKGE
ncbi:MAG: GTP-binding protein [Erysipelotrichaceae bacterium]|nr:GTP-binding protein [Erysipelotrichaceae bacterium]